MPTLASPPSCAVLVDEHVLDSYLAIAALRPGRVIAVHSDACAGIGDRLRRVAAERLATRVDLFAVADDSSPAEAAALLERLPSDVHLHHTGGTGTLASLLRAAHASAGRPPADASALDEERRLLRFDDGRDIPLRDLVDPRAVNFGVLCALHGFTARRDERMDERQALVRSAIEDVDWADADPTADAILGRLRAALARRRPGTGGYQRDGLWAPFVAGGAFENLVAELLRRVDPELETQVGVQLDRDGMRLELDVLAIGRYRPYVVSCTATANGKTVKHKLFEVLTRARQVGGYTARPAVACLIAPDAPITPTELTDMGRTAPDPAGGPWVVGAADILAALDGGEAPALLQLLERGAAS